MRAVRPAFSLLILAFSTLSARAQQESLDRTSLTIYNQDFAVARTLIDLDLKSGLNVVTTTHVTSQLEPDSVVLRDPTGKTPFKVTEQNYDAGVVDQNSLLQKFEGKTIQFARTTQDGKTAVVDGKVIRAGNQPLIESEGHLQFQLPGTPLFPVSTDGLLLKPTLRWQIESARPTRLRAELAYITRGMFWQATYNVVAPEARQTTTDEPVELLGWVTIQNNTGTDFPQARIKLMAGDVAKIRDFTVRGRGGAYDRLDSFTTTAAYNSIPAVTQQSFDDFHLYDLNRTVSLASAETKQVEFLNASGITFHRVYEYDGLSEPTPNLCASCLYEQRGFGVPTSTKVKVRAEIKNSPSNHLGMPLPAGRIRLYRRDAAGQMEFIGEGTIPHTPAEETVKVPVGSAFDVTGDRKQTDFHVDQRAHTIDETFEIIVKNQKTTPVEVAVVEHLNRALNWQIATSSTNYTKRDSHTIEFPMTTAPAGETKLTYTVHYTW